ncbi:cupin domain-containing protein [Ornithinimicrobium faecis]|uniref:cupin domain-containing protein n=1 Tax=Ornithinimicrobium faecis TaxID=2934158 RepID=UPI00211927C9|nr:DUF4437 domain-containing protein [Ornithinimicrobium sp. HY1745]
MPLPLVDFVCVDDLTPHSVTIRVAAGGGPEVQVRTLNLDPTTHARSAVVTVPSGAVLPAGHWSCDLELLVLEGTAHLGDEALLRYGYVYRPEGVAHPELRVGPTGLRLLVFTSGESRLTPAGRDLVGAPQGRSVGPVHLADLDWERPVTPDFPAGAGRKTLRDDQAAGEAFWVLGLLPHWHSPMREWHTFAEENYILEGKVETAVGLMEEGSYLAHPAGPDTEHGPMRSRTGALLITRAIGPMGNTYTPTTHRLEGAWT